VGHLPANEALARAETLVNAESSAAYEWLKANNYQYH
jgi:hypothetical protein